MSGDFGAEPGWNEGPRAAELAEGLRSALRDEYAGAGEYEMQEAVDALMDAMSPAEAFNFGSALGRIAQDAGKFLSNPAVASVAGAALPVLGGVAGTVIGGPVGTALGSQLGTLAAGALTRGAPPPSAPSVRVPATGAAASTAPAGSGTPPGVVVPPAVTGGSAAAAQGLVLTQQKDVLQSLLATALGAQGRKEVSGIPNAQVLAQLSRLFAQAAADADALMYLERGAENTESLGESAASDSLYGDLLSVDNSELYEAAAWEGLY